jgi:geranylgeranyl pyrophosphate synthase/predicted secreted hydrolase
MNLPALLFDEPPQPDSKLEWWFFHGRFGGEQVAERYFMASVFRTRLADRNDHSADAFSALISVLDPTTGRQSALSRVDRSLVEALGRPNADDRVDPFSPRVVADELRQYGVPREFECPAAQPSFSSDPLSFDWGDLRLASQSRGIQLAFDEPGTGRPLFFELTPAAPRLVLDAAREVGGPEEAMQYTTWPVMRLRGTAGDLEIAGEGWFDHQWGGWAWFRSGDSTPRARGWDWLGFRLDDGSQGMLSTNWDVQSAEETFRHLTLRDCSGTVQDCRCFEWTPLRWWTSVGTRIAHPVEWRLRVPEWDMELEFAPLADNQEIRVFGPLRAIWEGAGRVRGRVRGRPVEGPARLEGQGRGYLPGLRTYLRGWAGLVDRELVRFLPKAVEESDIRRYAGPPAWLYEPSSYTSTLAAPLWDLMGRDGKRWRAVFSFLLLDALGRNPEPLLDVMFVLPELLHNASLIIDDIQDGSALRRGQEAIHRRYGLDIAISAANTAYFLPLLLVQDHAVLTAAEKQATCEAYQRQLVRAHLGQSLDIFWTHTLSAAQLEGWIADSIGPKILQMYALKTAAPIEGLAEVGALLAGSGPAARQSVMRFARSMGLAFQLIDDVKDFCSSPGWGKQPGEDLRSGKLTYLILRALERLAPPERGFLRDLLCRPDWRRDPDVLNHGIELVRHSGACEQVREEARALMAPAWEALSLSVPPSSSKTELRFLWESLVEVSMENRDRS